jgi:polyketide synthase 5
VLILTGPKNGDAEDQSPLLDHEYVQHLVRIPRELPEIPGEPPRLYVVTRNAQTVLAGERPNLEQTGLRGLMRVIGAEHPHLRATQVDVDADTDAEQLAQQVSASKHQLRRRAGRVRPLPCLRGGGCRSWAPTSPGW